MTDPMNSKRKKEIDALRNRLATLEAQEKRDLQKKETLEKAHSQLRETLESTEATLEDFVRHLYKDVKRIFTRIERESAKAEPGKAKGQVVKKKATAKKRRQKRKAPVVTVKIPAGRYAHIPEAPDQVFEVKEKGARPKLLKAYAEQIGLERFMQECRLPEE